MLEVRVRKSYGKFHAAFDFSIASPSIAVVAGKSGAGKTTLAKMLAGLAAPDCGRIAYCGRTFFDSARGINLPPERRGIGFVFQEHRLFPHMTVRENILFGNRYGGRKSAPKLDDITELLDIGRIIDRYPRSLSGGEAQRAALGRALCSCETFLVMDEPMASLDTGLKRILTDYIAQIPKRFAVPIIYITHNQEEIKKLSDITIAAGGESAA